MSKSQMELIAYNSFFVFVILFTPLALTWISAGFGLISHDAVGGLGIVMVGMWPVVLILFGAAAISSLICFIGGPLRLRVRLLILWISILLPYRMADVPPPQLASTIGIIGFGLAFSLPIIWIKRAATL